MLAVVARAASAGASAAARRSCAALAVRSAVVAVQASHSLSVVRCCTACWLESRSCHGPYIYLRWG